MNDAWIKMGERARHTRFWKQSEEGRNRRSGETGENRRGDKREIIGERRN